MPRPKGDSDTLYGYLLYEPVGILDPNYMCTVGEIARLVQGLPPQDDLAEETENRIIRWTTPWIAANRENFATNDPWSDKPDYSDLHPDAVLEADEG